MNVTTIGGGTGTTAVLKGLRDYPDLTLNVIVSMTDDGGSNATVRDEFGLLPLSDLRKSIIALSKRNKDEIFRRLFMYRFSSGSGLSGHTLGNLIMIALSDITGSEVDAIKSCSEIFDIQGNIIPVTLDSVRLVAKYDDGSTVVGEHFIDENLTNAKIINLKVKGMASANPNAIKAIDEADYIVIGPRDLYTSLIANLVIPGISDALKRSKAKLVYISNLMSKGGETRGYKLSDLVNEIQRYVGRDLDVLITNNGHVPKEVDDLYRNDGEHPFEDDISSKKFTKLEVIREDIISNIKVRKSKGDTLRRSIIRHSSEKLGQVLYGYMRKKHFDLFSWLVKDLS